MKRLSLQCVGWLVGSFVFLLRRTCRVRLHNDPRSELSRRGIPHVFALLHAHQLAASVASDRGTAAMVSRSADGEIIIPTLRVCGHVPIRGSSGASKGGASALQSMIAHVATGNPALLAVDGPRGPRGCVQGGIGLLAKKSGAVILAVIAVPSRRWIVSSSWDRLQIPKPFSIIDCYCAEPIEPRPRESLQQLAGRIESALRGLEAEYDPREEASNPRRSTKMHADRPAAA